MYISCTQNDDVEYDDREGTDPEGHTDKKSLFAKRKAEQSSPLSPAWRPTLKYVIQPM